MKKCLTIGLDLGNFDVKTQNTVTPSGFAAYSTLPYGTEKYVYFNNTYYVPNNQRFSYERDKTASENAIVLSLLGISAEILKEAEKQNKRKMDAAEKDPTKASKVIGVQGELDRLEEIRLGIGLPPTHVSTLEGKTKKYYENYLKDGIEYIYNGYKISFKLTEVRCYPQDFAAVLTYRPKDREESAISYPNFYAVDIGGWTVDVVSVVNGRPTMELCDSKPLGVLAMYDKMAKELELKTGLRLDQTDLECILKDEKTLLSNEVIESVKELANEWYKNIMSSLKQFGLKLDMYPVIFIGGGAQLFKKNIKADKSIAKYEFIPGARANAIGYATLMELNK